MPIEKVKSRPLPTASVPVSRSKRTITFMPGPPATIMQPIPCQAASPAVVNTNMSELGVIIITDAQSVSSEGAVLTRKGNKQIYNNNMEQHRGKLKWKKRYSRNGTQDEPQNNVYAVPSQENKVRPFYGRTQSDRTSSRSKQLKAMKPERRRSENYTPHSTSATKMKPWKSHQRSPQPRQTELPQGQMVSATIRRKTVPNASQSQIHPYLNFSRRCVSTYTSREEINNSRPQIIDARKFDPLQQESKKTQSVPQATSRRSKSPLTIDIPNQAAFDEVERESGMQHLRKRFLRSSKSKELAKASSRSPYTSREEINNPRPQIDASKFDPPQQESKKTQSAPTATSRTSNPPPRTEISDQAAFDKDEREFGMQHLRKRFLRSSKSEKLAKASTRSLNISSSKLLASTNLLDGRQKPLSVPLGQEERQFEVKNTVNSTSQRRSSSSVISVDHNLHIDDAINCCSTVLCSNLSKNKITEDVQHHPPSEDNLQMLTEGRCKYGKCNCDFCDQYDWLEHSRYSLETRQNNKCHQRILNKLYEIYTPYNPLDDEEFMTGYETQMSWMKMPTTEKKTQLRGSSNSISSLQQSSEKLKSMMKDTILAFERRESIVSSRPSIPENTIQLTLPSSHSLPEDTINIVRLIPGNTHCCDCGISEENDGAPILWASVSYGIILCKKCAFERISNNQKVSSFCECRQQLKAYICWEIFVSKMSLPSFDLLCCRLQHLNIPIGSR